MAPESGEWEFKPGPSDYRLSLLGLISEPGGVGSSHCAYAGLVRPLRQGFESLEMKLSGQFLLGPSSPER